MKLLIMSSQHKELYSVDYLEAQTSSGGVVIKLGHSPMIFTLTPQNELSFMLTTGEKKIIYITRPGFLEVDRLSCTVLLNQKVE